SSLWVWILALSPSVWLALLLTLSGSVLCLCLGLHSVAVGRPRMRGQRLQNSFETTIKTLLRQPTAAALLRHVAPATKALVVTLQLSFLVVTSHFEFYFTTNLVVSPKVGK